MTAPRSTRAAKAPASSKKPTLTLADLAVEAPKEMFTVDVGIGAPIELISVDELDWQLAATLSPNQPFSFFESVVPEDRYEDFLSAKFKLASMKKLIQAYLDFYGLDEGSQGN